MKFVGPLTSGIAGLNCTWSRNAKMVPGWGVGEGAHRGLGILTPWWLTDRWTYGTMIGHDEEWLPILVEHSRKKFELFVLWSKFRLEPLLFQVRADFFPFRSPNEKQSWNFTKKTSTAESRRYIRCDFFIVTHCIADHDVIWRFTHKNDFISHSKIT